MIILAHHIAGWLGIPAGLLIAGLFIARKRGLAAWRAHRQQAKGAAAVPPRERSAFR